MLMGKCIYNKDYIYIYIFFFFFLRAGLSWVLRELERGELFSTVQAPPTS